MGTSGRLLLHVGLPKTGSTAVQTYFFDNRAALAAEGVHWSTAMRPGHAQLAACFAAEPNRVTESLGVRSHSDQLRLRRRLGRRLSGEAATGADILVSSEHLTTMLPSAKEVAALADFCHAIFERIEVVAVLRRGDHWLPSSYAEAVAGGSQRRFDPAFVHFRAPFLDHRALIERWTAAFGQDALHLAPMLEQDKSHASAVPERILEAFGLKSTITASWPVPAHVARPGLSAHGTEVLRSITPLLPTPGLRPGRERERLRAALAERFPGRAVGLTPSAARELDALNWVHTGVETMPQALGTQWLAWCEEPAAEIHEFEAISTAEAAEILATLQSEGVVRRPSARLGPALRRAAIRLLR